MLFGLRPRRRRLPGTCALLLVLVLGAPAAAQSESRPVAGFGETVEVTEVQLDVLVTDRKGNVILGLGPEDFEVEEKQKGRVRLKDVTFYSNRFQLLDELPPGQRIQKPAPNEVIADRYFVLFFHDVKRLDEPDRRLLRQQFDAARESRAWVAEGLRQGDWMAVASWDVKLKIHQDFTQEPRELQRAIDDAVIGKDPGNIWPSRRDAPGDRPSLLRHLPAGHDLRDETPRMYDALRVLGDAMAPIVGRKNVLLFTIGFGDVRPGFTTRPDPRYYGPMRRTLNDHNVAIYPIDLVPATTEHAQTHFLQQLADETGGEFWDQFVAFTTPLREISDENSGYYLLSYQSEHPAGQDGYQEVEVRTVDRSFRVRARAGYEYGD